jgi:hypothetical protein
VRISAWPLLLFAALVIGVRPTEAQEPSHWGVSVSVTPSWRLAGQLEELIEDDEASIDLEGSEVTVGVVRGSQLGGEWGVSFVHKPFENGSTIVVRDQECFGSTCLPTTEANVFQDVKLTGVEGHWFWRIVNIRERVQIGLNIAGGVATPDGEIIRTTDSYEATSFNPQTGAVAVTPRQRVEVLSASDELFPVFPLFKLEAAGSFIVAPGLKIRVAGGLNFPAYGARVGMVYLFGAR